MDQDSEMEALRIELEKANQLLEQASTEIVPFDEKEDALTEEEREVYRAYEAKVAALRAEKMANNKARKEAEAKKRAAEYETEKIKARIREAERLARLAAEEAERLAKLEAQKEELLALNEKWDKLTLAAPWREWAKDHQINAGHFMVPNRNVILADPMGLGKTLSAIITCDMAEAASRKASPDWPFLGEEKEVYVGNGEYQSKIVNSITRPVGKKILYLCPSSLMRNVVSEFRMWAGHRSVLFIGDMPRASRDFAIDAISDRPDWVLICNYEAWRKDLSLIDKLSDLNPDTIIMDEAHNVKNMKTSAYKGIDRLLQLSRPEYVIPMTGTPVLNRPQELYTLLHIVNPNEFATENDFLYNYCEQDLDSGYWKFRTGGLESLQLKIGKNFLRRTKDQAGIILPEKTVITHTLEVDKETYPNQARVREQMAKYATIKIDDTKAISAAAIIAMYTRLRQIETWPAGIKMIDPKTKEITLQVDVEESQKVDYTISKEPDEFGNYLGLIPEGIEDDRFVLFSQFKAPLYEIKKRIESAGYRAVIMDGDTPQDLRNIIARDFDARYTPDRNKAQWDVVLCNYRVGGVGLNLTAATQLIVLDEEWNPGKREQAYDRIHRMGQENPVTIHVIRNEKTIDDWLANIMSRKEDMVDGFNNSVSGDVDDFKEFLDNGGLM